MRILDWDPEISITDFIIEYDITNIILESFSANGPDYFFIFFKSKLFEKKPSKRKMTV